MILLPGFRDPISRHLYLRASLVLLVGQYLAHLLVDYAASSAAWTLLPSPAVALAFWSTSTRPSGAAGPELLLLTILDIAVTWSLLVLAIRRARTMARSKVVACLISVPIVQLFILFWLGDDRIHRTAETNIPGARDDFSTWSDGTFVWLFGGEGLNVSGADPNAPAWNDLWKYPVK